jgi:hypothetical protein
MSVGVWWGGSSWDGDEVMCGRLMCVWMMAMCICRMHLHNRVCDMYGVCGMVCVWLGMLVGVWLDVVGRSITG